MNQNLNPDVNQGNKDARWVQHFLVWSQGVMDRVFLDLLQAVEKRECDFEVWCGGVWNSQLQANLRGKFYDFII